MRPLSKRWNDLFGFAPNGYMEVLLLLLLTVAFRHGVGALLQSPQSFRAASAFDPVAVYVKPVGWAACLPRQWVFSQTVNKTIAAIVCVSCLFWAFKLLLPWSALSTAISYAVLISYRESRLFNYVHDLLPAVALLLLFACFYTLRFGEIRLSLQRYAFWQTDLYAPWLFGLIIVYMGLYYTFGGLTKLSMGGFSAGSGLSLQLTMDACSPNPVAAMPMIHYRWLATIGMTMTVILESGAVVMFLIPRTRPWWSLGIVGLHVMVLLTLNISFMINVMVLMWMAIPGEACLAHIRKWLQCRLGSMRINPDHLHGAGGLLVRLAYSVDVFRLLEIDSAATTPQWSFGLPCQA